MVGNWCHGPPEGAYTTVEQRSGIARDRSEEVWAGLSRIRLNALETGSPCKELRPPP